jgi:hypothetical protein
LSASAACTLAWPMSGTRAEKSNGMIVHASIRSPPMAARAIRSRPLASGPSGSAGMVMEIISPGSRRRKMTRALIIRCRTAAVAISVSSASRSMACSW